MEVKEKVKYPGVEVHLQNMTLEIPTLNFKLMREGALAKLDIVIDAFEAMQKGAESGVNRLSLPDDAIDAAVDLVWMAAKRNYPDLSKDQVADGLDMDNINQVIPILITKNPLKVVKKEKNSVPQATQ